MGLVAALTRYRTLAPFIALLGLFIALCGWSFAAPVGATPDENFHLASTWCAAGNADGLCEPTGKSDSRWVPEELIQSSCYAFVPEASAKCQLKHPAGVVGGMAIATHGNFQNNYPPIFYGTMRLFVTDNIQLSVLSMRVFNALLFCLILGMTFWLVSSNIKKSMYWMWAGTLVPLAMFLIPSVNPSSWAIIAVGTSWLVFDSFLKSKGMKQILTGALYSLLVIMAAGARGDAAIYVCLTTGIVILYNFPAIKLFWKKLWLPVVMVSIAVLLFFSSAQSSVASTGLYSGGVAPNWSTAEKIQLLLANVLQLPALWAGVFGMTSIGAPAVSIGNLGWLDTQMPMIVWLPALAAYVGLAYSGLRNYSKLKIVSLGLLVLAITVLPLYVLQRSFAGVGAEVQPRYLLPLIVVLLGVALLNSKGKISEILPNKIQTILLIGSLIVANSVALHFVMRRFITGIDVRGVNLNTAQEWWWSGMPFSPMIIWICCSVGFAIALIFGALSIFRKELPKLAS